MKEINGYTRTCGLLGNPVEHTMSPVIHNFLAEKTNKNLAYVPFCVPEGQLEEAVGGAYAMNVLGLNVTVPYKSAVIPFLAEIDPLAEQIGAVNTLVRTQEGFKGYNTDMPGLYRAMCRDGVTIEGACVLILGAGGVARAAAMLAAQKGAAEIILANRNLLRAQELAKSVNEYAGSSSARAMTLEDARKLPGKGRYLAIQATSVGMFPRVEETLIEDEEFFEKIHTAYDLIPNPSVTRFMKLAAQHGCPVYNGLKMLLYQGVIAYELWTGTQIEDSLAEEAYGRLKEAMGI